MDPPDDPLAYKDAVFISPHKFIGGPGTPGVLVARRELFRNRVPEHARRRHRAVRQPVRARLPVRDRAPRGGRHARDRRVDPRRPRVPAEGRRRRRGDPRARARLHPPRDGALVGQPLDRDPRQPRREAAVDRVVRRPPRRPLPAPQLRRRPAQRPVRDPVARRLLVCRALRAPPAGHRHRDLARVRARDRARLRGDQARLDPGQLQLLHQRGGVRVPARRGRPRGERRVAVPARLRLRARDRPVAPPRGPPGAAREPARRPLRRRADGLAVAPPPRARVAAGGVPRGGARAAHAAGRGAGEPSLHDGEVGPDFETLRWFWLPEEVAAAADRARA